ITPKKTSDSLLTNPTATKNPHLPFGQSSTPTATMKATADFLTFTITLLTAGVVVIALSKPTLTVSPTVLNRSGDAVTVTWSNVPSPSSLDWVGIYSPPDSRHDHFIGYKFLSSSPGWESGSGSLSIPITNLRSNFSFRIFGWNKDEVNQKHHDHDQNPIPASKHQLAESGHVGFGSGKPEQIHLAFTDEEDEMRVMFVAGDGEQRKVRWRREEEDGGEWGDVAAARVVRYEREDMCDSPANSSVGWRDPGWIHDAVMKGLEKGLRYYYQVGSDSKGWSATQTFVSRNSDANETIAFLFGDMGTSAPYTTFVRTQTESISTVKWILRDMEQLGDKPAFVSHIGDISYANGYSWIWDHFFTQIEPIASKLPYHVCIGNHEYDWPAQPWKPDWAYAYGTDGGGECGVPYSSKFIMPGNSSEPTGMVGSKAPDTKNLYYSFDVGPVHFVYMSTETNFLIGSRQYEFLKRDLESVNRSKTPFVVFQGHRPMYTTSKLDRDAPMRQKLQENLEHLLVNNNVTIALWGHVHSYERFCPMNNFRCGTTWPGFPVHVVIGMAGQDWQSIWEPRPDHPDMPVFPQPDISMYRGGEFGYTRLHATREKLTFSYVGNHDGEVHDTVEMLVSGEVLGARNDKINRADDDDVDDSEFENYVKGGIILVLGALLGYLVGFVSHGGKKRNLAPKGQWTAVRSEET
ncbi:Probable inactive purple acid phosphatase 2, partial [Linum grandiflorum]